MEQQLQTLFESSWFTSGPKTYMPTSDIAMKNNLDIWSTKIVVADKIATRNELLLDKVGKKILIAVRRPEI